MEFQRRGVMLVMASPSGAGKSSLLDAGLRPALEAKEFLVSPTIRVSQHVEGAANRYVASTMLSLEQLIRVKMTTCMA